MEWNEGTKKLGPKAIHPFHSSKGGAGAAIFFDQKLERWQQDTPKKAKEWARNSQPIPPI
jgi:hypothetical protein